MALVDVVRRHVRHVVREVVGQVELPQLRLRGLVMVVAQLLVHGLRRDVDQ